MIYCLDRLKCGIVSNTTADITLFRSRLCEFIDLNIDPLLVIMIHCTVDHFIDELTADSTTEEEVITSSSQRLVEAAREGPSTRPLPQACPIPRRLTIGRGVGGAPVTSKLVEVREMDFNLISKTIDGLDLDKYD